jgi:DMSO reductase anchor subunit
MKNIKTSWLSREALALGVFTLLMNVVVILYMLELSQGIRLFVEFLTLTCGVFGIYAQAMIYRIKARPAWNRTTTNMKFFGVAYVGLFLLAFVTTVFGMVEVAYPLITLAMLGALSQLFFTYEDLRTLKSEKENEYQLKRTARLYDENFKNIKLFRFVSIVLGGVLLPLLVILFLGSASFATASLVMFVSLALMFASELSDRFLFYATVVPLGMAGGFFVGKQR